VCVLQITSKKKTWRMIVSTGLTPWYLLIVLYRITRGLVLTRPSVDRKKAHLCTNGFLSSLLVPTSEGNLNDIFVFLFTR
jgi:hypothetical protein